MSRWLWATLALGAIPASSWAANAQHPRTPVVFGATPCMTTIERGEVFRIDYAIPFEDAELTTDELPDSRRHQFIAFDRQTFDYRFPVWISSADLARATANGDVTEGFGADDVLETSSQWPAASWVRINADNERIPITFADSAEGVSWDTSAAHAGTWLIGGYTWEPELNLWTPRLGAVRIIDPADPRAAGPSAFLGVRELVYGAPGDSIAIPACIAAPAGSTMRLDWGALTGIDEPTWEMLFDGDQAPEGEVEFGFDIPREAADAEIKLRLTVTDPDGRSYVAYTPAKLQVAGGLAGDDDASAGCAVGPPVGRSRSLAMVALVVLASLRRRRRR